MLAITFPGQGSQVVGMGRNLFETYAVAKEAFEQADEILGWSVSRMCFEGPDAELRRTKNTQPAIFTTQLAILRVLQAEYDFPVAFAAGHSLGEFSALVAAGAMSFEDGLKLVQRRSELMDVSATTDQGMLAVSEIASTDVASLLSQLEALGFELDVAAFNGPEQTVLAGKEDALHAAQDKLAQIGARSARLNVQLAFHSRLMADCADLFEQTLSEVPWQPFAYPVVANLTARPHRADPNSIQRLLKDQLVSPVNWLGTVRFLCEQGVTHILELGANDVLGRLSRSVLPSLKTSVVNDAADIPKAGTFLSEINKEQLDLTVLARCLAHAAATRNASDQTSSVADFNAACRDPFNDILQRYQDLSETQGQVPHDDVKKAISMLDQIMNFKRVGTAEQESRWEEVAWFDRNHLVSSELRV